MPPSRCSPLNRHMRSNISLHSARVIGSVEGHQIIRFSSQLGRKLGAQAEVDATGATLPELTLLLALGFFLLIVANETMPVSILATH